MKLSSVILCCLAFALLGTLSTASADQKADEKEYAALQAELIKVGATENNWKGVLVKIDRYGDPKRGQAFGAVLTDIFDPSSELLNDVSIDNQHRLLAFLATFLAEWEPVRDMPLARLVISRLASDEKLLTRFRDSLFIDPDTGRSEGWDRLLREAEAMLKSAEAKEDLDHAVWLLSQEQKSHVADSIAVLWIKAGESDHGGVTPAAYLDAFERLTTHRFPEIIKAVTFLNTWSTDFAERTTWTNLTRANLSHEIVRAASKLSGAASSDGENAVRWGTELVQQAKTPEKLMRFLNPATTPYLELRAVAMRHAESLSPEPTKAWVDLVRAMLLLVEDQALKSAIAIMDKPAFAQRNAELEPLAGDIVTRLRDRADKDTPASRKKLVKVLGVIGTFSNIIAALNDIKEHLEHGHDDVYAELIKISGQTEGASVGPIVKHYFAKLGAEQPSPKVRDAVVDALGGSAVRGDPQQGKLAALFLRLIFEGGDQPDVLAADVPETVVAETADSVRQTILYRLERYPDPDTIDLLFRVASGENAAESDAAVKVLSQLWSKKRGDAAEQLTRILKNVDVDPRATDELLINVLKSLEGGPADLPEEIRPNMTRLQQAARALIDADRASLPVQQAAAAAATAMRDPKALIPVFVLWMKAEDGEPAKAWEVLLRNLIEKLCPKDDAQHDAAVAALVAQKMIEAKRYAVGIDIARTLTETTDRPIFLTAQASLVAARSDDATVGDEASRRDDVERALELYKELMTRVGNGEKLDARRKAIEFSEKRAGLADDDTEEGKQERARFLLEAMLIAADSNDKALAEEAVARTYVAILEIAFPPESQEMKDAEALHTRLQETIKNG